MPFIGLIEAQLKANDADFRTKMAESGKAVEKFDSQLKKFGLGFGGVALAASAFRAIVDYARDLDNPLNENLKRAKAFAEGLDEAKGFMLEIGAKTLGVVNGIGEWLGKQVAIVAHGREQVSIAEQIEKQTQETLAAIEKDKKLTEEIGKLKSATREVEKKATEEATKQLDIGAQILIQQQKLAAAQDARASAEGNKLETAKAELAIVTERAALEKLTADQRKKSEEEVNKAREEGVTLHIAAMDRLVEAESKAAADRIDAHIATMDKLVKLREAQLPLATQIKNLETIAAQQAKSLVAAKAEGKDTSVIEVALLTTQNELAEKRKALTAQQLEGEKAITEELRAQMAVRDRVTTITNKTRTSADDVKFLENQLETAQRAVQAAALNNNAGSNPANQAAYSDAVARANELERQLRTARASSSSGLSGAFTTVGRYDEDLSDLALEDKIRTLTSSIMARQQKLRASGAPDPMTGAGGYDFFLPNELRQVESAKAELSARNRARDLVGRYGEEGAAQYYKGNIPEFERLLNFAKDPGDIKRAADGIAELNQRLGNSKLFPKR